MWRPSSISNCFFQILLGVQGRGSRVSWGATEHPGLSPAQQVVEILDVPSVALLSGSQTWPGFTGPRFSRPAWQPLQTRSCLAAPLLVRTGQAHSLLPRQPAANPAGPGQECLAFLGGQPARSLLEAHESRPPVSECSLGTCSRLAVPESRGDGALAAGGSRQNNLERSDVCSAHPWPRPRRHVTASANLGVTRF